MTVNVKSLQARLLNVAKERNSSFQLLLNRLGSEQFLYRLSISPYAKKFVFKGGSLLTYLIESDRRTKDLDFSIKDISNEVDEAVKIISTILEMPVDDGFHWKKVVGEPLNHPEMEIPGVRVHCHFLLGKMKGTVHMDLALGDVVDVIKLPLQRIKYKGEPFFPEELALLVYPPEAVFSEKMQIALEKGAQNTRMKDYYDLFKLCSHKLDGRKLRDSIESTFKSRKVDSSHQLVFTATELARLETYWGHFLNRDKLEDAPETIDEVIETINRYLKNLYEE